MLSGAGIVYQKRAVHDHERLKRKCKQMSPQHTRTCLYRSWSSSISHHCLVRLALLNSSLRIPYCKQDSQILQKGPLFPRNWSIPNPKKRCLWTHMVIQMSDTANPQTQHANSQILRATFQAQPKPKPISELQDTPTLPLPVGRLPG